MRTTLDLPGKLLAEARRASGARTKTQTIVWGLEELIRTKKIETLWNLRGKIAPLDIDLRKSRAR
ncbi:MAG: type II toxin-antitoxin system VapB family antitoxin [Elusimicrobiota bacterium]